MNLEEFKKTLVGINQEMSKIIHQLEVLRAKEKDVKQKYINGNAKFPVSTIVACFIFQTWNQYEWKRGYVKNISVNNDGIIFYEIGKLKKDGSPSQTGILTSTEEGKIKTCEVGGNHENI